MDNQSNTIPPLRSLFLFLAVILVSSAPVIIEQMNNPKRAADKLLSHIEAWQVIYDGADESGWYPSDGTVAEDVAANPTNSGVEVVFGEMKAQTREAFFNAQSATPKVFRLTAQVGIPKSGNNGLVFRGNDQGEYYLFLAGESSYTVEILRREANSDLPREAIILNTSIPSFIGQPHALSVLGDGTHYYFYINDILVDGMSDSRLNGNRTGIEAFT